MSQLCANTTYGERESLRDAYWRRCDAARVEGEGCESFAGFVARVRRFEQALGARRPDETMVVFTHGMLMQALLWLHAQPDGVMAEFDGFRQRVTVPNCALLRASMDGLSVGHLPADLRTG